MNESLKILNLEPDGYSSAAKCVLESLGIVDNGPFDQKTLSATIADYDILIVRLAHRIDANMLASATRLKIIVTATTGLNHIDMEAAARYGIHVLSLRGETKFLKNVHATAEHAWAMLLSLVRQIQPATEHVLEGGWERDRFRARELNEKTLGIIGFGRLGRIVARYGVAFGMRVLAYDRNDSIQYPKYLKRVDMDALITSSDVISLHASDSLDNRSLISYPQFAKMKAGAILINTARPGLVDEYALLHFLQSNHIGGAALDGLRNEYENTDSSSQLIDYAARHKNLMITPHVGGCTFESMERTELFMAHKLLDYVRQRKIPL